MLDAFWMQSMQGSIQGQYECIKAFSETDFTSDLKKMTIPTLFMHGDADQVVPIQIASEKSVKIVPKGTLKVYPGAPHGMCVTHAAEVRQGRYPKLFRLPPYSEATCPPERTSTSFERRLER